MKTLLILLLLLIPFKLAAPDRHELIIFQVPAVTFTDVLIEAIGQVESGNNDFAVNDKEGAYGRYQIRAIKRAWYAKKTGIYYTWGHCFDKSVSKSILMYHLNQYDDYEEAVKAWNGSGPMTEVYLKRVKQNL